MNMGMKFEFLVPGVQNTEKSDLSAEMLGVPGDLDQCLGAEAEQQPIHHVLILQGQRRQFVWEREDNMRVRRGQQFGTACVEPAVARVALALGAMPPPEGTPGTSCRRWRDGHSSNTHRDGLPARRCGIARWRRAP